MLQRPAFLNQGSLRTSRVHFDHLLAAHCRPARHKIRVHARKWGYSDQVKCVPFHDCLLLLQSRSFFSCNTHSD